MIGKLVVLIGAVLVTVAVGTAGVAISMIAGTIASR